MEVQHIACAKGHGERIWSVAWNPVDDIFATCSSDCSVRIWRLQRRKEPSSSKAHLCASSSRNCCVDYDIILEVCSTAFMQIEGIFIRYPSIR